MTRAVGVYRKAIGSEMTPIAASALFSVFAANFGNFGATYGGLAGVVVLMLWLQISVFVVLLGAELNAETEHQTAVDSTTGPPEPMGARGAVMADTLGASRTAHTERRDA